MKLKNVIEAITGESRRRKAVADTVPPVIATALQRVIDHFRAVAEASYKQTAMFYRIDHVYRDIRSLETWLTEWFPTKEGSNYSTKLPSLGDVVLTMTGTRLVPRDRLDQVLDAHFMHRWYDEEDIAAIEGRYSQQRDVSGHRGIVETCHYIPVADGGRMIKAKVETKITVTTTVSADLANRPATSKAGVYIHDTAPKQARNWSPEWEEWI